MTSTHAVPPPQSWDTHFHVFEADDQGAADPSAAYTPADAPMAALNRMHETIGIDRGVLVQATSVLPDHDRFMAQLRGNPRLAGVAIVGDATSDASLSSLHAAGVRGIRFHFASFIKRRPSMETFHRSVARVAELGWHVLVHLETPDLIELAPMLTRLPAPVVIDHMAHVRVRDGLEQPGFRELLALQRHEHVWVKLGNSDRWSVEGAPRYDDAIPFGAALIANGVERLIWGTDWPHVMYKDPRDPGDAPPDDGDLLDLLFAFAHHDDGILRRILVDNPLQLYGASRLPDQR